MSDAGVVETVDSKVRKLKKEKRKAKELKQRVTVGDFHSRASMGPGGVPEQINKRSRKRSRLTANNKVAGAWQRREHSTMRSNRAPSVAIQEAGGDIACSPAPPVPTPMTHFASDMQKQRLKSMQKVSQAVTRDNSTDGAAPQTDAYAIVAEAERCGLSGPQSRVSSANLARHLQKANVRDRWMTERGSKMTDNERVSVEDHVQAWVREGVPRLPPEYRDRHDLFRIGSSDFRNRSEDTGEPVSKLYIQDFLRTPCRANGERPCAAGHACQGEQMFERSWSNGINSAEVGRMSKIMREFLTPREQTRFKDRGDLPKERHFCIVCERYITSMHVKFRSIHNGDATVADYAGQMGRHTVMVDQDGEYDSQACLFSESPVAGITRMYLAHRDNCYIYRISAVDTQQPFVALDEINVSYEERLN